jgi:hypothetical protein
MALALSDYAENIVINRFLRNQAFTPPPIVYLALFSTATTDAGGGTEAVGGSYARKAITLSAASLGVSANTAEITFPNMPAGTWTHAAIIDATTGGNFLFHGPLVTSKTSVAGQNLGVSIGELDVGFTSASNATDYLRNKIIDHMLRNQAFTPPASVYSGLYTTATTRTGGGTEVTGGGYTRQVMALVAPSGGVTSNSAVVDHILPAATVTHMALHDAVSGGNMLLQSALTASITSDAGDIARWAVGDYDLVVT